MILYLVIEMFVIEVEIIFLSYTGMFLHMYVYNSNRQSQSVSFFLD